ncbi:MAG: GDP-mannose 4,6-dehydratase [Rhodospirillales bacterium]|nr:GDP-mannose 4,6-dehydratase [Rhodospirillales bacterium]USO08638.1 MAG: GDP-mannose 4,6-dehydratase [Rhodospirillales bacterium]
MHKTAFIFGVTGQDGSYLAELLLSKGYRVHGMVRRTSVDNHVRIRGLDLTLHNGDMADAGSIWRALAAAQPDEVYNLAAQSHVHVSFSEPEHTGDIDALGCVRVMDALRTLKPDAKFYQASTSELFGQGGGPFDETSPMVPASPYGAAKFYAFHMVRIYRESYGLFACNGILFNHESPRRGSNFVTAKIAAFAHNVRNGSWNGEPLALGNLDARRDWGHARDYVEGMWRMLQQGRSDDYVLATGTAYSVRDFVDAALPDLVWSGEAVSETARDAKGRLIVRVDPALYRPLDVPALIGDAGKARRVLGWTPTTAFKDLVAEMVEGEARNPALRPLRAGLAPL